VERSTYHYRFRRADPAQLRQRIKEIVESRVRYGYRRIHVLLRREGWTVHHKRVRQLYNELAWIIHRLIGLSAELAAVATARTSVGVAA
jgi:transposase InsO family protein